MHNYNLHEVKEQRNVISILLLGSLATLMLAKLTYLNSKKEYKLGVLGKIGEASYTIYLIHTLLLSVFIRICTGIISRFDIVLSYPLLQLLFIVILVAILLSCYIFYKFIEAPVLKVLNDFFLKKKETFKPKDRVLKEVF